MDARVLYCREMQSGSAPNGARLRWTRSALEYKATDPLDI